jgi:hypothetical protein
MKKQELRVTKITLRDPKYTMSPVEYGIWKAQWDRLWNKLIGQAVQQVEEERKKGIKSKHTPKSELIKRSFEMAKQLDIQLPRTLNRYFYDDVYLIEAQLEYELKLKNLEKDGCEVVFEPPRLPTSEIVTRMIERAKTHKARGQKSFKDW